MKKSTGVLITNIGSPDSSSVHDVRRYLKSFLSDPHVVRIPRILWQPILNLLILRIRAPYSAKLYQSIWTPEGSPLTVMMERLKKKLEKHLCSQWNKPVFVECGMHYGNPSIAEALEKLRARTIETLFVLPLFPQYSTATTQTTYHQMKHHVSEHSPFKLKFISHYSDRPEYITALARHIQEHHDPKRYLLFSFHGLPKHFVTQGEHYAKSCHQTAHDVAAELHLSEDQWSMAYQSRIGYARWLTPYTFDVLRQLPQRGIHHLSIICPGFSVDCLETLEEIQLRGKHEFLGHGGQLFHYIPALNDSDRHVETLGRILGF